MPKILIFILFIIWAVTLSCSHNPRYQSDVSNDIFIDFHQPYFSYNVNSKGNIEYTITCQKSSVDLIVIANSLLSNTTVNSNLIRVYNVHHIQYKLNTDSVDFTIFMSHSILHYKVDFSGGGWFLNSYEILSTW